MPYSEHWLFTYGGTLGTHGEIWSNNIRMSPLAASGGIVQEMDMLDDMLNDVKVMFATQGRIGNHVKCTYGKFNKIGTDGFYKSKTESNTRFLDGAAAFSGTVGTNYTPYQTSVVISTLTDKQRGRGSKGRLFAPGFAGPIEQEGTITLSDANAIATSYALLFKNLGNWPGVDTTNMQPVVASGIDGSMNAITKVKVGLVPDTMRSRRNALAENYVTKPLP